VKKKSHAIWWVLGVILVLYVIGSALGDSPGWGDSDDTGIGGDTTHSVTYRVNSTGSSSADMTYFSEDGDIEQQGGEPLPWEHELNGVSSGSYVSVSAQQDGSGVVTCEILVDGIPVNESTSSGEFSICDASATI
jgi:hypothetical protein